jgi:hypothetical protein
VWATREEVAAFFNIHRKTLYNFFERCREALVIYEDAKLSGNVSQRRRNVRLAETSAAMSIFLSKNQLGTPSAGRSTTSIRCSMFSCRSLAMEHMGR